MPISTVSLTNTFDEWRIKTNQVITSLNTINEANASLTGTLTLTNPSAYQGNVSLNVASGMIKGDGGLLTNLQSSVVASAAYDQANIAYSYAIGAPSSSSVNLAWQTANASYLIANLAYNKANQGGASISATAPTTPAAGALWWNDIYGKLLIYYDDGNSSQWVDAVSSAGVDLSGPYGTANAGYAVANAGYAVANAAFNAANNAVTDYSPAFNKANVAYTVANAAFDKANTSTGVPTVTNDNSTDSTRYVMFTSATSGNAAINVASSKLTFNPSTGTLSATIFNSLSDATLKDNVSPINNALDIINSISGVGFDWKQSGKHSYGVLAQNMEQVVPELVDKIDDLKTVNYDGIIAFLIEAIKELNKKIESKE